MAWHWGPCPETPSYSRPPWAKTAVCCLKPTDTCMGAEPNTQVDTAIHGPQPQPQPQPEHPAASTQAHTSSQQWCPQICRG